MPLTIEFLTGIRKFVVAKDGKNLRDWLSVEPNASQTYWNMRRELKREFRKGSKALDKLIERGLPEDDDVPEDRGTPWPSFNNFIKDYLEYWRDAELENPAMNDLTDLYIRMSNLVTSCATALSHPSHGSIMFETSLGLSGAFSRLVVELNRAPEFASGLESLNAGPDEERKTIVESAAETIQKCFTLCLTDRSSDRHSEPRGKKIGVYIFANLVLKLLFTCHKSGLAKQLFTNINASAPALALYPASQRVTYLYYLGRFNFENDHYQRAARCLEAAYAQTPPRLVSHRAKILTYLVPANVLCGRFPSAALLARPEAAELARLYPALQAAVAKGDFAALAAALAAHFDYLWRRGLYLALHYRLRALCWRSLTRRTFLLTYHPSADARKAATLALADVLTAAAYVQRRLEEGPRPHPHPHPQPAAAAAAARASRPGAAGHGVNPLFLRAVVNNAAVAAPAPVAGTRRPLRPADGLVWGHLPVGEGDVDAVVAGLVAQELLHGWIHSTTRQFVIVGARQKGPLNAGWPAVAEVLAEREKGANGGGGGGGGGEEDVPAWVRD